MIKVGLGTQLSAMDILDKHSCYFEKDKKAEIEVCLVFEIAKVYIEEILAEMTFVQIVAVY